jgi:two-component system chemotaxis response regulator CheY
VIPVARILVVDDEPHVRDVVRRTLEHAGHDVTDAEDGLKALNYCRANPVDLVVTDLFMPVMDGLELIVQLGEKCPGTKVLAISGAVYEKRPRFLEIAGRMASVVTLSKPFTVEELLNAAQAALDL